MIKELDKQLNDLLGADNIKKEEPMKEHTTFRIGGPADYFVVPNTKELLVKTLDLCRDWKVPVYVTGNGSNLLVGDKGFRGVILHIGRQMNRIWFEEENQVRAQAGVMLSRFSREVALKGLSGLEFASGIPGTLGGAIAMNAGAYGGEIKDVLKEATIINEDHKVMVLSKEELKLGYRKSLIQEKGYVVLEAVFLLPEGSPDDILSKMAQLNKKRQEKQPLNFPSAGSTFKRPEGYFAGKLIEDTGLRGFRVGNASISMKHCGFVVNMGDATAKDVVLLMEEVDKRVFEKFGVHLEPEIRRIGEF